MKEEDIGNKYQGASSGVPDDVPVKRKRGRPRKDKSQVLGEQSATPTLTPPTSTATPLTATSDTEQNMLGQQVFGVIDGTFEAGYLVTVKVGNTDTTLKGIVFRAGAVVPVSEANDLAPNQKMLKRAEIPIPQVDPASHTNASPKVEGVPPKASLRVTRSALASRSQPQTTEGVQNVNHGTPVTPMQTPSEKKGKAASTSPASASLRNDTVKKGNLPGTKSASSSKARGDEYPVKTENQEVQDDKPPAAALAHKEPKAEQIPEFHTYL